MKVFISGKITGVPRLEAVEKFSLAEEKLRGKGYEVVNPAKNETLPTQELLTSLNIIQMMGCDMVFMLQDWRFCRQAVIERNVAEITGKVIQFEAAPRFLAILDAIQEVAGCSFQDISGQARERRFVYSRMIFTHHCHQGKNTLTQIARDINRDHSTVLYYLKKYQDDYRFTAEFRELCDKVEIRIKELTNEI